MDMNEIGATVRRARKQRGLSQAELALKLGMSRATLSGIETGKIAEVGIRKVMALCAVLGLELVTHERRLYPTLPELRQALKDKMS